MSGFGGKLFAFLPIFLVFFYEEADRRTSSVLSSKFLFANNDAMVSENSRDLNQSGNGKINFD